jgi:uncharacterized protein
VSKILITGASGLIGKKLTERLLARGHEVSHLGRRKGTGKVRSFTWDVHRHFIQNGALEGVDTIVHLAGAGIADKPWTESRKREILESRTLSSRLLYEALKNTDHKVKTFVSASAIGYYGFEDENRMLTENDGPGSDYLAHVVRKWEEEVDEIAGLGLRVVKIRVGIVLSREGGALPEIAKPVRLYAGAPLGSGNQHLSWIHVDDLCSAFVMATEDERFNGAYNGVGPYPVTNKELTRAIGRTLNKPVILPAVPGFILRMLFGEMADLVLRGSKVSSQKLLSMGFEYRFNTLEDALQDLLVKR